MQGVLPQDRLSLHFTVYHMTKRRRRTKLDGNLKAYGSLAYADTALQADPSRAIAFYEAIQRLASGKRWDGDRNREPKREYITPTK